jgi:two-component system sensor histidine kinase MtrB
MSSTRVVRGNRGSGNNRPLAEVDAPATAAAGGDQRSAEQGFGLGADVDPVAASTDGGPAVAGRPRPRTDRSAAAAVSTPTGAAGRDRDGASRLDAAARALRRTRRHSVEAVGWLSDRWRRSLQLRVAATTLLVSTVVVVVVGVLLVNTITAGLLEAKKRAAHAETKNGLRIAESQLSVVVSSDDPDSLQRTLRTVTADLASRGTNAGLFSIAVVSEGEERQTYTSGEISLSSIPDSLRHVVDQGHLADIYAPIVFSNGRVGKGLIVGTPVAAPLGSFRLFYLFPLQAEERTVALVRRTVALTGILLVLLLGGIAGLVTRQVVRPVRAAAQTAERFATGRLEQRMRVRGKDELALLASAFNDMADSLQRQIRKLEDMSRLQRRFTSDVSHELRTPLTTVRMAADVLYSSRTDFPPEVARSAELLQNELDRFESLLVDLLEISRYDARVAVLEAEPADLRPLVRGVVEATAAIADQQGSAVLVDLPEQPVVAEVDPRRVERILRNLVINAVEHGAGLPVEVRLVGSSDAIAVTVRDHGVGLRPGEAGLVFDRFWRADPSRDRRTGGTGLGLSISLEDARLHGGWLHVWGRPGAGAQFRLTLPVHSGAPLVSSPLPVEPAGAIPPRLGAGRPSAGGDGAG